MKGDTLSSGTFWHGKLLNDWATDWVAYHTGGKGEFVTTAMEDTGTMQSLTLLAKAGRVDLNRVLVLRTASNYDMPPEGVTPAENLARLKLGAYTAYLPSLEGRSREAGELGDRPARGRRDVRHVQPVPDPRQPEGCGEPTRDVARMAALRHIPDAVRGVLATGAR